MKKVMTFVLVMTLSVFSISMIGCGKPADKPVDDTTTSGDSGTTGDTSGDTSTTDTSTTTEGSGSSDTSK